MAPSEGEASQILTENISGLKTGRKEKGIVWTETEFPLLGFRGLASAAVVQLPAATSTSTPRYAAPLGANHGLEGT